MEPIILTWWAWLIIGFVLMLAELVTPTGFFLFFFGVGAVATALLSWVGVLSAFVTQGLAFTIISLFCVFVLRKPLTAKFHVHGSPGRVDSLVGQTAKALEPMDPQAFGRVELRGTAWAALNNGSVLIPFDARCKVEKVDGLTLHVSIQETP